MDSFDIVDVNKIGQPNAAMGREGIHYSQSKAKQRKLEKSNKDRQASNFNNSTVFQNMQFKLVAQGRGREWGRFAERRE